MRLTIPRVMYADALLNAAVMLAILLSASALAAALQLPSPSPLYGVAALVALGALFHAVTGRSGNRTAVRVMVAMDATVVLVTTVLAIFNLLDAPGWIRLLLVGGGVLALVMGALKVIALRVTPSGRDPAASDGLHPASL